MFHGSEAWEVGVSQETIKFLLLAFKHALIVGSDFHSTIKKKLLYKPNTLRKKGFTGPLEFLAKEIEPFA